MKVCHSILKLMRKTFTLFQKTKFPNALKRFKLIWRLRCYLKKHNVIGNCPSKLPENTSDISSSTTSATGSFEVTSDFSCYSATIVTEKENVEKRVVFVIERNPKLYLGIPAPSLFLIEMICSKRQIGKMEVYNYNIEENKTKLNFFCSGR